MGLQYNSLLYQGGFTNTKVQSYEMDIGEWVVQWEMGSKQGNANPNTDYSLMNLPSHKTFSRLVNIKLSLLQTSEPLNE